MADTGGSGGGDAKPPKRKRNLRQRPAGDEGDASDGDGCGAASALADARALARLRERKTVCGDWGGGVRARRLPTLPRRPCLHPFLFQGLSADALLTLAARAKAGTDALLVPADTAAEAAAADAGAAGSLAGAYVRASAADAAAAAAAADADAYVEAELARRLGLPPPERTTAPCGADAWRGERDALYAVPDELRGQVSNVGPDAGAAGGAAVAEVVLSADDAARNVERTEAAKRALLGLAPLPVVDPAAERRAADAAARAALPRSFGVGGGGRGRGRGRRD